MRRIFIVSIVMFMVVGIMSTGFANAEFSQKTSKSEVRYTNTESVSSSIAIRGGKAACCTDVSGKTGTTKIHITINLQKKSNGNWSTIRTWSGTKSSRYYSLSKTEKVSKGTYRLKSVVTVYRGSKNETITKYTGSKKY